jgi:DNA excision repair protein ERCC-3
LIYRPENPLIVQGDKSVLVEVANALFDAARDLLARFAELEKSPEFIHTYRITPLSLWNAAAAGMSADAILDTLQRYSKYDVPGNIVVDVRDYVSRYGRIKLLRGGDGDLLLVSDDLALMTEIATHKRIQPYLLGRLDAYTLRVNPAMRGHVKQALVAIGYPAEDLAGYVEGAPLDIRLRAIAASGLPFALRAYQTEAADVFHAGGSAAGGSGVIVLPCGAGKTMVGMAAMEKLAAHTLILTPSTVAARQWMTELLDKTTLTEDLIGEYTGLHKDIRPVTVSTYQVLTWRPRRAARAHPVLSEAKEFPHFRLFNERDWGLIIYDEVHLLPAPVFRMTAEIQARRRLGLTATLVREDGHETDVFSLIGPKKYDVPWKDLERQGWIATAECHEIRLAMDEDLRLEYAVAGEREKYGLAARNPRKLDIVDQLLAKHHDDQVLVIGQYLDQLAAIAARADAPLIVGETRVREREKLYDQFRRGEVKRLVISKVGNFSIDLPDANVAIQVSGTFGSRQEEAQRLGRILRPKRHGLLAHFYSLVSRDTRDQEFAARRQLFLTEQGYRYDILYEQEVADFQPATIAGQAHLVPHRLLSAASEQAAR